MVPHHHDKRLDALRTRLGVWGADVFISFDPADNAWLTGFFGSTSMVAVTAEEAWLFCDFRYLEQARASVTAAQVVEFSGAAEPFLARHLNTFSLKRAVCDPSVMTLACYNRLKEHYEGELTAQPDVCRALRTVKEEGEIARIEAASLLAEDALRTVLGEIRPGMEETELAGRLDYAFRQRGAQRSSFDTIVLFGEGSSLPHGKPGKRELQPGDIILIDCGCVLDGYCSDLTRTFVYKQSPGAWFQEIYDCVYQAQAAALASVRDGISTRAVDDTARTAIKNGGFGEYFGHGTGHGVGLEIHESPRLNPESEAVLASGMVVTVEPGIYLPGRGGVRIEDLLVVTPAGSRVLTVLPKELRIL